MAARKKPAEAKQPIKRKAIKAKPTLALWVKSGGRCALCNRYLLEEEFFERPINLGERAHIAGATDAKGSPRGQSSVPLSKREEAENLVLLCGGCHDIVDDTQLRADYPEERLLEIKHEHEERIRHLTDLKSERESTVVRLFGMIRGAMPELARAATVEAVFRETGRFARFRLAPDRTSIEVDLTRLADPETVSASSYWQMGANAIDQAVALIAGGVRQGLITHLSVFALARIPLLVYLGYALDDKMPVELFQKQRDGDEGWGWQEGSPTIEFQRRVLRQGTGADIVLLLSVSGTVKLEDLPASLKEWPVHEITPVGENPNPNLFRAKDSLDMFRRSYQDFLASLEAGGTSVRRIHLFPAVPITAAIVCGRSIMRDVHPELLVYERLKSEFELAMTLNKR